MLRHVAQRTARANALNREGGDVRRRDAGHAAGLIEKWRQQYEDTELQDNEQDEQDGPNNEPDNEPDNEPERLTFASMFSSDVAVRQHRHARARRGKIRRLRGFRDDDPTESPHRESFEAAFALDHH